MVLALKTANAKKIIKSAAIGLVIIFASYSIASYVLGRLLAAAGLAGTTTTTAARPIPATPPRVAFSPPSRAVRHPNRSVRRIRTASTTPPAPRTSA